MDNASLCEKVKKIISSCNTHEQLFVAGNIMDNAIKAFDISKREVNAVHDAMQLTKDLKTTYLCQSKRLNNRQRITICEGNTA